VVAESALVRHQLLIWNRGRKRAPNLRAGDRIITGLCTLFMRPSRNLRSAIVVKPSSVFPQPAEETQVPHVVLTAARSSAWTKGFHPTTWRTIPPAPRRGVLSAGFAPIWCDGYAWTRGHQSSSDAREFSIYGGTVEDNLDLSFVTVPFSNCSCALLGSRGHKPDSNERSCLELRGKPNRIYTS
jgi:hypothetical protein